MVAVASQENTPPLTPGTVVEDRYRIIGEIGGGGMGYVFEAEHIALERRFALKVLRVGHWDKELIQRFEREARALAKIDSARVAQVSDFGIAENIGPFYVMELVAGQTLQQLMDSGPISVNDSVRIAIELCEAIHDVHERGIVHRDLKPGNIGITHGPLPIKLLDFGLAASVDDEFLTRITQSHQVLGSLPYIPPEQFTGARPDPSQDLWALGIILYEMVAGKLPFEAPSTPALMHKILTSPPPLVDGIPAPVREVIEGLLNKDPNQRIATAQEAAMRLEAIQLDGPELTADGGVVTRTTTQIRSEKHRSGIERRRSVDVLAQTARNPSNPSAYTRTPKRMWAALGLLGSAVVGLSIALFTQGTPEVDGQADRTELLPDTANVDSAPTPAEGTQDGLDEETPTLAEGPEGNEPDEDSPAGGSEGLQPETMANVGDNVGDETPGVPTVAPTQDQARTQTTTRPRRPRRPRETRPQPASMVGSSQMAETPPPSMETRPWDGEIIIE